MPSDPSPDFLHSIKSDEFLPPISLWTTLGGLVIVGAVGVAVTLASIIKYNTTVKAAATIRPTGELRIVQAATEGTVKLIEVKENQTVKQGQAIATIDDSRLQIQKSQLQGNIQQDKAQLAQIEAQISALDTQAAAEQSFINRTTTSAEAELRGNLRNYQNQKVVTQSEVQEAETSLDIAKSQLKMLEPLAKQGVISQVQLQETRQAFVVAVGKLERAKAAQNPSASAVEVAKERIAQERARGEASLATLSRERKELIQRRITTQSQLNKSQKELQQLGIDLYKSVIRAPVDGTILKLDLRNPGQTVRPGEFIAQIAPSDAPLVVKARIAAQDISKVKTCKAEKIKNCEEGKVQLRFSAYPYPDYGTLKGAVRAIAPDAITSQGSGTGQGSGTSASSYQGSGTGASSYEVTIQPERSYLVKGGHQYPIQSGMEVTADIISREETVLTFMLRRARLLTDL